jgi:2-methylcitrate dehydratase PrpD
MARLGRAIFPPTPVRDWASYGWLPPQLFGYFGGAAVAGRLLGLDEAKLVSAFGLAYSQAAGNMEPLFGVSADKGIYQSYPAQASILAVLMAAKGIAGAPRSLEGKSGLYRLFFRGEYDPVALTADLGKRFLAEELGLYAYPCCGYTQIYVASALEAAREHRIAPEDIGAVTLSVGPRAMNLCEPREVRCSPRILSEAQMSIPFAVATALAHGKPRIEHFTRAGLRDPATLAIAARTTWKADPACDKSYGTAICEAGIEIQLKSGRSVRIRERGYRYGHPQNPIGRDERMEKLRDCMAYSVKPMAAGAVEQLISMVEELESLDDVSRIADLIA